MRKIIDKLTRLAFTKTAKNTYLVFAGNSLAGFLGMILMVLVSRRLGPEKFGVFSVSFALLSLLAKFADLGFNFAMVKNISQARVHNNQKRIKKIFETVFTSKVFLSIIITVIGYFTVPFLSNQLFKSPQSLLPNKLLMIFFAFFVFYDLVKVYFQANKRFLESTLVYITANIFKLFLVLVALIIGLGLQWLIFIYVLAPFLSGLVFFGKTGQKIVLNFDKKEFKKLFKFSMWMGISVVLAALAENLNVFMISSKLSEYETGVYSAAEKFILPFSIFSGALATVLISRVSEFLELGQIKRFIKKVLFLQALFLIAMIGIIPFTPLITVLLGKAYGPSVQILQILIAAVYFQMAITPLNSVFYPLEKSEIFAIDSAIKVVLLFLLNRRLIGAYGAKGAAYSLLVVNVVIFAVNYLYLFFEIKNYEK